MEQEIYVDVLLATNYVVNTLLIICTGKLSGRSPKRRRIVAAALFGGAASLTIFLPFLGFFTSLLLKLFISAAIIFIAFSYVNVRVFLKQIFFFFAVSFSFAGIMLGLLLTLAPRWLLFYNGIVYFNISPMALLAATILAYGILILAGKIVKGTKLTGEIYSAAIFIGGKSVTLKGLVDTGNHLREPFSDSPVVICNAEQIKELLPQRLVGLVMEGGVTSHSIYDCGIPVRLIPYANVGGSGILPAVKADYMIIKRLYQTIKIEQVYIGLSDSKIGGEKYSCLLTPDLTGLAVNLKNTVTVVPRK